MTKEQIQVCTEALAAKQMLDSNAILTFAKFIKREASGLKQGRPIIYKDAHTWDWTKSDPEMSREKGICISVIKSIRLRLGFAPVPAPHHPSRLLAERADWNWTKSDADLGRDHKMSRERVRQIRAELKLPPSMETRSGRQKEFLDWVAGRTSIKHIEACRAGFLGSQVKEWCEKNGIERKLKTTKGICKIQWEKYNWQLPNWALAEAWGTGVQTISGRRSTLGLPKAVRVIKRHRSKIADLIDAEKAKSAQ